MKPIVEKVLKSGIVDKGMVELLERWGNLPEGSTELLQSDKLKDATKEQLTKFAEELADEVAKEHILRETQFDLENLRWPTSVSVQAKTDTAPGPEKGIFNLPAMVDRMGRLYFRAQDVEPEWFIPGYILHRSPFDKDQKTPVPVTEKVLEMTPLYVGDQVIALQVTTARLNTY